MARKCKISGLSRQSGHRVSHAKNRTKHTFLANLQPRKLFIAEENKYVRVRISTRVMRTIDKIGLTKTLKKYNMTIKDLMN